MFDHVSGFPGAKDRGPTALDRAGLVFIGGRYLQPSEFNELQTLLRHQIAAVGGMVAAEGDRQSGGDAVVEVDDPDTTATVRLAEGTVYVGGLLLPVPAKDIPNVPTSGDIAIGVFLERTFIDHEDDATLLGIDEGTASYNEPGAGREIQKLTWGLSTDTITGRFVQVYLMRNGTILNQDPPPALTGVLRQLSSYDFDSNGHYIVEGCRVVALGKLGADQVFSVSAGTANISGWKRIREAAIRLPVPEEPDLETIDAEPHTYVDSGDGTAIVSVNRAPIASVTSAIVTKEITESVVRGATPGGSDVLGQSSIVEILEVTQGGTTFDPGAYGLSGDSISWANAGDEPAQASTYSVRYLYFDAVTPIEVTPTTVKVGGGVAGRTLTLSYTSKLPRIDLIGLEQSGGAVYVKGISARRGALPAKPPSGILKLAEVRNDWINLPVVTNNGTRNYTYDQQLRLFSLLEKVVRQFDRSEQQRDVQSRAAVSREGIFTDLFVSSFYRDEGEPQTAAINRGVLQLAVDQVGIRRSSVSAMLDYVEEVILSQPLSSRPMKINPYANATTMPAELVLEPPTDFWTENVTNFIDGITTELTAAPGTPPGTTTFTQEVSEEVTEAKVLREIDIEFSIDGFAANETLESMTFDGVDILPDPAPVADLDGKISGTFTIPALVPTGARLVRADGLAGSFAEALFVGEGTIETEVMQRVTLVTRAAPPPIINNITNITNVTNVVRNSGGAGEGRGRDAVDPLAQTFSLTEGRHVAGFDFWVGAVGDDNKGVRVQLCTTLNGYPTNQVLAEVFVSMAGKQVGDLIEARFAFPIYLQPAVEFCFVIMTDDPDHAVMIARQGDVDPETGQLISQPAYAIGVMFSSSNRLTWNAHQFDDIKFRMIGARFDPLTKVEEIWKGTLPQFTDMVLRGSVERPSQNTNSRYELVRATGQVIPLAEGQTIEFNEILDEEITIRAVISGTETESPIVWPGTTLIVGKIRDQGQYISRVFPIDGQTEAQVVFAQKLPAGSSLTVDMDKADDNWQPLSVTTTRDLGDGWQEPIYKITPHDAPNGGRVRIVLNGSAGSRPSIAELRAFGV
jgi:hypothetical protein